MEKDRYKVAFIINILIFLLTVFASIVMFTGFKFMHGIEPQLECSAFDMFKFFTVDSNMFMGIVALLFAIQEIRFINGKIESIDSIWYIFKLIATVGVSLTFVTVFAYLGPISKGGIMSMLMNSNLFFHLFIPVLSIVSFIFFERTNKLNFKCSFYGPIPMLLYGVFYTTNVLLHIENGSVSTKYDWYWFTQNGLWTIVFTIPLMFTVTYIISLFLWKFNKTT